MDRKRNTIYVIPLFKVRRKDWEFFESLEGKKYSVFFPNIRCRPDLLSSFVRLRYFRWEEFQIIFNVKSV